jgi:hypothetical protein
MRGADGGKKYSRQKKPHAVGTIPAHATRRDIRCSQAHYASRKRDDENRSITIDWIGDAFVNGRGHFWRLPLHA